MSYTEAAHDLAMQVHDAVNPGKHSVHLTNFGAAEEKIAKALQDAYEAGKSERHASVEKKLDNLRNVLKILLRRVDDALDDVSKLVDR